MHQKSLNHSTTVGLLLYLGILLRDMNCPKRMFELLTRLRWIPSLSVIKARIKEYTLSLQGVVGERDKEEKVKYQIWDNIDILAVVNYFGTNKSASFIHGLTKISIFPSTDPPKIQPQEKLKKGELERFLVSFSKEELESDYINGVILSDEEEIKKLGSSIGHQYKDNHTFSKTNFWIHNVAVPCGTCKNEDIYIHNYLNFCNHCLTKRNPFH